MRDVATSLPGKPPNRPNDLCFGPDGLLYYTDPHNWEDLATIGVGRVARATLAGAVELVAEIPSFPNGIAFGADDRLYVELGTGSEPTNCCLGDGRLYVTLSGPGELVALDMPVEPLPLYPARATAR